MQSRRIQTTGKRSSARRYDKVVRSGQTGDAVQQDHNVLLVLHKTLRPLDHHLRNPLVVLRQFVECRVDHLYVRAFDRLLDIRHFLRSFIDQKNDQMRVRSRPCQRLRHFLEQRCLTGFRRGHDHSSLSFSDRTHQIHDTHGNRCSGCFQTQSFVREDRRQIFEAHPAHGNLRRIAVDRLDKKQRTEFLILRLDPCIALQNISGTKSETADLARRHIHVVLPGQIVFAADETKAVAHNLQDSLGRHAAVQLSRELLFLCSHAAVRASCRLLNFFSSAFLRALLCCRLTPSRSHAALLVFPFSARCRISRHRISRCCISRRRIPRCRVSRHIFTVSACASLSLLSGCTRALYAGRFPFRLILLILRQHSLHDLCLFHCRCSFDSSCLCDLLEICECKRFILFSHILLLPLFSSGLVFAGFLSEFSILQYPF